MALVILFCQGLFLRGQHIYQHGTFQVVVIATQSFSQSFSLQQQHLVANFTLRLNPPLYIAGRTERLVVGTPYSGFIGCTVLGGTQTNAQGIKSGTTYGILKS